MKVGQMVQAKFHFGHIKFEHPGGAILQSAENTGLKLSDSKVGDQTHDLKVISFFYVRWWWLKSQESRGRESSRDQAETGRQRKLRGVPKKPT